MAVFSNLLDYFSSLVHWLVFGFILDFLVYLSRVACRAYAILIHISLYVLFLAIYASLRFIPLLSLGQSNLVTKRLRLVLLKSYG